MATRRTYRRGAALVAIACIATLCAGSVRAQLSVTADHADGIYRAGETVHWTVRWEGPGAAPAAVIYIVKRGGLTDAGHDSLMLRDGAATLEMKMDAPGTALLEVTAPSALVPGSKVWRALGGAVAAPERILPSAERPVDFDAFWAAKVKELQGVPPNPKLEATDGGKEGVSYWHVTLDNIRGSHIHGQLARPASGEKFPALLIVQWAGVYGLQKSWVTDRAAEGWLALNIEAHDLPIDEPPAFYQEQAAGPLKNYWAIGNDDRDTSYFLRMYLSCYRAADYLAHRPDWDGRTLVVMGTSQGGLQTLMIAGLYPHFTAALADVPAGCDMLGPDVGRAPGWPQWYWHTQGKDAAKVRAASRYYDVVNFASRIRCPVLVGAGLIDETCPPAGVLAAANQIRSPHEVLLYPHGGHQDEHNSHGLFTKRCWQDWLPALREGKAAPVTVQNAK